METIKNEYQLSKTVRFSLTQKNKSKKDCVEEFKSHRELQDLVNSSLDRIKETVLSNEDDAKRLSIETIDSTVCNMKLFLADWSKVCHRKDQIAVDKDYYKVLCKKIGFDGFWMQENRRQNTRQKMPQCREIVLSSLEKKVNGKRRYDYILDYWRGHLLGASDAYTALSEKIAQYKVALEMNRADNMPNEVELRKMFLAFANLTLEILQPIVSRQILFPKLARLDNSNKDNEWLIAFVADDGKRYLDLLKDITELKKYFDENGGNVPLYRATLNEMTAIKNPKSTDTGICEEIKRLGIDKIIKENQDVLSFERKIWDLSAKEKMERLNSRDKSNFMASLLFKYKPIPATVQFEMAHVLSKGLERPYEDVLEFIRSLGRERSPAKDYADLKDKADFNMDIYPLKVAFDFAWEGLARFRFHKDIDFPVEKSRKFLKDVFDIDEKTNYFVLYAQLLELNALLSTLQNASPNDENVVMDEIKRIIEKIDWSGIKGNKDVISSWVENPDRSKSDRSLKDAKQRIGLFRGQQKNKNKKYEDITKSYKDKAMEIGKIFAQMRDKITGAAEVNKITHYAMIVEDKNYDRYVLLQEFVEKKAERIYNKAKKSDNEFIAYYVNSVTSASISKMIRKKRTSNEFDKMRELSDSERERQNIAEWKLFIEEKGWDIEFDLNLEKESFEQIKKEVDSKCYFLEEKGFSMEMLSDLVREKGCLLLPIVNKDLEKEEKTEKNQFTKDWNSLFQGNSTWRLTPEFRISYRKPTPHYPVSPTGDKRYSRFQLTGHFLCEYIPQSDKYISIREQLDRYKDDEGQKESIKEFNTRIRTGADAGKSGENVQDFLQAFNKKHGHQSPSHKKRSGQAIDGHSESFYVFGIDRGQKELATLCIIDQDKKIVGPQRIYVRSFNGEKKRWEHTFLEERHILDLSNLRVETTLCIDGEDRAEKVLVDLSEVKVKDKDGNYTKPNKMQVAMQQLAYIRKLQFKMQTEPDVVLDWYERNSTEDLIKLNFVDKENGEKGVVSFYGAAVEELGETLPVDKIKEKLDVFKVLKEREKKGEGVKDELDALVQLEPVDNLKSGVVANMVGVIAHLLKKYNYQVYISLEDLSDSFDSKKVDGITGVPIKVGKGEGRRYDVERYAGLGLYNFFEMQLLKKLFRIQQDSDNILHLVPSFRAMKNYDFVAAGKDKVKNQFGIVFFVDAAATSKTCPCCDACNNDKYRPDPKKYPNARKHVVDKKKVWVERDKSNGNDIIRCFVCGFDTTKEYSENPLKFLKSGDDNAAYLISTSAIKAYELAKSAVEGEFRK